MREGHKEEGLMGEEDVCKANSKVGWFLAMLLLASVLSVGSVLHSVFMRVLCCVFLGLRCRWCGGRLFILPSSSVFARLQSELCYWIRNCL